jgi:hypothetical protein
MDEHQESARTAFGAKNVHLFHGMVAVSDIEVAVELVPGCLGLPAPAIEMLGRIGHRLAIVIALLEVGGLVVHGPDPLRYL